MLIRAGQAIVANDPQAALLNLKNAAGKMPSSIVEKAITTMASKLRHGLLGRGEARCSPTRP